MANLSFDPSLERVSKPAALERRVVHYRGVVQGVGFRYTTRSVAEGYEVTGFVQNLPDGRVRLVCEGRPAELERFLTAVGNELDRYIESVQVEREPASGEFSGFTIQR